MARLVFDEDEEQRYYIEETEFYEITVETMEEAKEAYKKYIESGGYQIGMPLKLRYNESKFTDEDGEEVWNPYE